MSEEQNIAEENLPPKEPMQVSDPQLISTNKSPEMEVHHHAHVHEKIKWKEYLFQFLMLFLAVYLGTLAENRREHGVEAEKEKEYIESLIGDIDHDYRLSTNIAAALLIQAKKFDTLQDALFMDLQHDPKRDSIVRRCYDLSASVLTFYPEFFTERTTTQLLSSGNMRLIKKKGVADSIMEYHGYLKLVEVQKELYVNSANACIQSMYDVYDIAALKTIFRNDTLFNRDLEYVDLKLRTTDPNELKKFNALLETAKVIAFTYKNYLIQIQEKASNLYDFLKDKYNIKEE